MDDSAVAQTMKCFSGPGGGQGPQ